MSLNTRKSISFYSHQDKFLVSDFKYFRMWIIFWRWGVYNGLKIPVLRHNVDGALTMFWLFLCLLSLNVNSVRLSSALFPLFPMFRPFLPLSLSSPFSVFLFFPLCLCAAYVCVPCVSLLLVFMSVPSLSSHFLPQIPAAEQPGSRSRARNV